MASEVSSTNTSSDEPVPAHATFDLMCVGQRLGRYQLVMPLGQGGMGLVFAARLIGSHGVERLVAIKTLRPVSSAADRAALLCEARLTAKLHHRNVVATLDLGEADDVPYVVMELLDGVPLSRLLAEESARDARLAPELAAWIVMQAAQGLHAAHELADAAGKSLGLVHRDVSPHNILLSLQGEVKMADFGIAKYAGREEATAEGMIKGKFSYMSPEQASSGELDRRSDVFSLGIVLHEALTGERLFFADTPARTILRVIERAPTPPHELRAEVGAALSAITLRCLAKARDERYPTAGALADAIRAALRERHSHIDEGDLAARVAALFGDERARVMAQLKNADATTTSPDAAAAGPAPAPAPVAAPAAGEASGLAPVSMSASKTAVSAADPPVQAQDRSRRGAVVAAGGALLAVAIGAAVFASRGEPSVPSSGVAPVASITATGSAAPSTTEPASAPNAEEPRPPASVASVASAPGSSPPPVAASASSPRRVVRPPSTASTASPARPATATAPPARSGAPTTAVPFESL